MRTNIKLIIFVFIAAIVGLCGCTETEYSLGELKVPTDLDLTTTVIGVDTENPAGDGSGKVFISATASDNISCKVDFGDGKEPIILHTDTMTYKYSDPGTKEYVIILDAIGVGGTTSSISTNVSVFVNFQIPEDMLTALTNNASKTWVTDQDAVGHFGVGPASDVVIVNAFTPFWYAATPNSREPEAYDDEITFRVDELGGVHMIVDNKGLTFMLGAAVEFYGFTGPEGTYPLDTGGEKKLSFMDATSGSTADVSTQIQFDVPGNGIVNFGIGSNTYEILSISETSISLRTVGADGNAWYQMLAPMP